MTHNTMHRIFGVPQGFAQLLSEKGACVTYLPFLSPVPLDEVPEPPSPGRGCRRQATEDSGVSSLLNFRTYPQGHRPAPF